MVIFLLACAGPTPTPADAATWWVDWDGDGFGDPWSDAESVDRPDGAVENSDDCDDTRADVYPDAAERCDGWDNDCDGQVDNDAIDAVERWADVDGDGFGDPASATLACDGPLPTEPDCDDAAPDSHPGAVETCGDGVDQDCSGADCQTGAWTWRIEGTTEGSSFGSELVAGRFGPGPTSLIVAEVEHTRRFDGLSAAVVVASDATWSLGATTSGLKPLADIDGDGWADLSSSPYPYYSIWFHSAEAFDGASIGWTSDALMGPGGDLDGDGVAELLLSDTAGAEPALAAVRGPVTGGVGASSAWSSWTAEAGSGWSNVTAVLDLDGDGANELAAALLSDDLRGPCSLLVYSPLLLGGVQAVGDSDGRLSYSPLSVESCHGVSLVDVGDLDGDGLVDLGVGMPYATGNGGLAGQAWLVQASSLKLTALDEAPTSWLGQEREEQAGSAIAAGDFNGDGQRDLAVGTSGKPAGEDWGGFAVDLGPIEAGRWSTGALELGWTGENRFDQYSSHPMLAGDFDGDGVEDLAVGASAWPSFTHTGAVYVFGDGLFDR